MKRILFFLLCAFTSLLALAQGEGEGGATVNVTKTTTSTSGGTNIPWLWIVGGVVLLVLLIALLNGNRSRTVNRTTVIKD